MRCKTTWAGIHIWRRLLAHANTTIANLHHTVQITFGWADSHLDRFVNYGKDYGIAYLD
jgi:hypothetical protein